MKMSSLSKLVFIDHRDNKTTCMTEKDKRLTLAYEDLDDIPSNLVYSFGQFVHTLDISHNKFNYLHFLAKFENLTSLILDHNDVDSETVFPSLPNLQLLWLNHNKISRLYPFIRLLYKSCPRVLYLSLMGNEAAPSYLNGGTFHEYLQYRLFVLSWYKKLVHLDDLVVTDEQRHEAQRLYKRPFYHLLLNSDAVPSYLRGIHNTFASLFTNGRKYTSEISPLNAII